MNINPRLDLGRNQASVSRVHHINNLTYNHCYCESNIIWRNGYCYLHFHTMYWCYHLYSLVIQTRAVLASRVVGDIIVRIGISPDEIVMVIGIVVLILVAESLDEVVELAVFPASQSVSMVVWNVSPLKLQAYHLPNQDVTASIVVVDHVRDAVRIIALARCVDADSKRLR